MNFMERVERYRIRLVIRALRMANGHIGNAATLLGLHGEGLRHWIKRRGLLAHTKDYRVIGHPGKRGRRGPQRQGNAEWRALAGPAP